MLWEGTLKLSSVANTTAFKYDEKPHASAVCSAAHIYTWEN